MKRTILTTLSIALAMIASAQTPFEIAIKENLALLDSAKTTEAMQAVTGKFERIAMTETARWEPLYYAAFSQINMSFMETDGDKKDAILDQAQLSIDKAIALNCDKSEVYTLQGLLYQGRIMVSPMRGMSYSMKAAEILEKAIEANPENPRPYYLLGRNTYGTPKMFGGGSKNALPKFQEAKLKFDNEQVKDGIAPKWGAKSNQKMIDACTKNS